MGGTKPVWLFKVKKKTSKARGLRNLVFCCCFGSAQFLEIYFNCFYLFICMSGRMNVICVGAHVGASTERARSNEQLLLLTISKA